MRIRQVLITFDIQEKIFSKHNITREQIEEIFLDAPHFVRIRKNRYMGIGNIGTYITVLFDYLKDSAHVVTAYHSSKWQKRLYLK